PGEKLFEELLIGNKISETAHCRIMRSDEDIMPLSEINEKILQLQSAIKQDDLILVRSILQESITGFIPQCEVSDLLFKAEALNPPPQKPLMLISKIR
ncbi:MAG: polysaccharide biosynthesis protein, partial [Methylococcales bacterium]|nr:polysaccharide biosynthesis protein [Methylococcales bacterium]